MASRDYWSKFYWGDWRKDAKLCRCSRAAKGVWMDFLAFVFESDEPGYAVENGHALSGEDIAAAMPGDPAEFVDKLAELEQRGVVKRDERGAYYSKRMADEFALRDARAAAGSKGGSKTQAKGEAKSKQDDKQTPKQASNSNSNSNSESNTGFERFWTAYPKHQRKVGKAKCKTHWKSKGLEAHADAIVAGVGRWAESEEWMKDGGAYICQPHRWLNERRWELEVSPAKSGKAKADAWESLGIEVHANLLHRVRESDPSIDHRPGNIDTQRAMRKLAKQEGLL